MHFAMLAAVDGVYRLEPAQLARATELYWHFTWLHFGGEAWSLLKLVLLLATGAVAWMRNVAVRTSRWVLVQAVVFFGLLMGASTVLGLPVRLYGHHVLVEYGLSVQSTASWLADAARSFGLTWAGAVLVGLLLWVLVKRSPRRWWLGFALIMMPVVAIGIFASPLVIDPLFDRFEPLAATHPDLVTELEQVVKRSGAVIPPDRMFLMHASDKWTGLNAYVTGFGASKRVVVWDTTIAKAPPEEIQMIFAHEMGHYVLNHLVRGYAEACMGLLVGAWLAYLLAGWLVRRFGVAWGGREYPHLNRGEAAIEMGHPETHRRRKPNWTYFGILLLVYAVMGVVAEPVQNALSRQIEHEADVYGQEAMHGIVADPQAVAAQSFQRLGEVDLDMPDPNAVVEFWTSSHPSITERKAFAAGYDPWAPGQTPKFFPKP